MIQLKDTPTKVYAIDAELFLSKVPLEVLQNWVLIQLIVTPHVLEKVQGKDVEIRKIAYKALCCDCSKVTSQLVSFQSQNLS